MKTSNPHNLPPLLFAEAVDIVKSQEIITESVVWLETEFQRVKSLLAEAQKNNDTDLVGQLENGLYNLITKAEHEDEIMAQWQRRYKRLMRAVKHHERQKRKKT